MSRKNRALPPHSAAEQPPRVACQCIRGKTLTHAYLQDCLQPISPLGPRPATPQRGPAAGRARSAPQGGRGIPAPSGRPIVFCGSPRGELCGIGLLGDEIGEIMATARAISSCVLASTCFDARDQGPRIDAFAKIF